MRIEDFERCAVGEPSAERATGGKEGVGEYRGAAEREKRFTPIHAIELRGRGTAVKNGT